MKNTGAASSLSYSDSDQSTLNVPQLLDARVSSSPDFIPLCIDNRVNLSYRDWEIKSRLAALNMLKMGGTPGARVALLFDGMDWVEYAIAYMAVLRFGGTTIHLNGHLSDAELQRRINECGVTWIIRSKFLAPPRRFEGQISTIDELCQFENKDPLSIVVSPDSIADIRYTSGTTGPAKAYLVSHANLTFGRTLESMTALSNTSMMLVPMTLGTTTSATLLTVGLTSTVPMMVCSPDNVERMGELIQNECIDSFMITPYIASQIVDSNLNDRYDLSSIRIFASASAPLAPTLVDALLAMVPGAQFHIACAQSEASPALLTHIYTPERPFSVGKPSSITELKIMGDNGNELSPGELGEIWLRSPAPKRLFFNAPVLNARLLDDGWYRTGDMGRINTCGEVEFFDRKVDMIKIKGERISSIAMEADLMEHPAIKEVAVVSAPHSHHNGEVVAFVVLKDPNTIHNLKVQLMENKPKAHYPDKFISVACLPRTHNGKVLKRQLKLDTGCYSSDL